jgi:hypothetical protein
MLRRLLIVFATLSFIPRPVGAEAIMPLSEVRAGMLGHGLTVFQGTNPERFDIEVIDVLHGFLPRQDLILIRMHHPVLEHSGTVGGMSGSPIYIGDRLIGALAYGWMFALDPIAGVTPIETMLEELDRPLRAPPVVGSPLPGRRGPGPSRGASFEAGSLLAPPTTAYFERFRGSDGPVPALTPLLVGGFSSRAQRLLGELLDEFSMVPVEAGGGGRGRDAGEARPFVPGAPLGVQLVRGDLSATAIGTVTAVRGSRVLAFGHPMFDQGQQHFPVVNARILHILASARRSFKIGEPEAEAGALVQDRQPCIVADTTRTGPMTPFDVRVDDRTTGRRDRYRFEVARDRFLLPVLGLSSLAAMLDRFASDRADLTVTVRGTIHPAGRSPLALEDQVFTDAGATDRGTLVAVRPVAALRRILDNGFEHAEIERVDLEVSLTFGRNEAEIIGAYVTTEEPEPGTEVPVHVVLRPYAGPEEVRIVRVEVPAGVAGEQLELRITGGRDTSPPTPEPRSLDDVIHNLQQTFPSTSIVVTLQRLAPGVSVRGHVAENLPPSALDSLRPLALDTGERQLRTVAQVTASTGWVLSGAANLGLRAGQPEN